MAEPSKVNLSEKLFAPRQTAKETSNLINLALPSTSQSHNAIDGQADSAWYRMLRRPLWAWQGIDPIEMEAIFSRLATSEAPRTNDDLIDTVIGYKPGNWIYEWSQAGSRYQKQARALLEQGEQEQGVELLIKSSMYYSVASYPHLKGDNLAAQAELQANQTYKEATQHASHQVRTIDVKFEGRTFEAFIHLPRTDKLLPTVIVSGGLDMLQSELWHLYKDYFGPAGFAMISLDMPSVGHCSKWALTEDTSRLHQALLQQVKDVPWVDHERVAMLGFRFGANSAIRLGFLEPNRLKACVSIGGAIHSLFTDPYRLKKLSRMQLEMLACRLGKNRVSSTSLTSYLPAFSLKNQGLLGRRKSTVPMLGIGLRGDPICSEADINLIALSSRQGKAIILPEKPLVDGYHRVLEDTVKWLKDHLR